jgi:hypothetical protein
MDGDGGEPRPRRLLDQVRNKLRTLHYSPRTEDAYVDWIRHYVFFQGKRHPKDLGAAEVEAFLTYLATQRGYRPRLRTRLCARCYFFISRCSGWSWAGWMGLHGPRSRSGSLWCLRARRLAKSWTRCAGATG